MLPRDGGGGLECGTIGSTPLKVVGSPGSQLPSLELSKSYLISINLGWLKGACYE